MCSDLFFYLNHASELSESFLFATLLWALIVTFLMLVTKFLPKALLIGGLYYGLEFILEGKSWQQGRKTDGTGHRYIRYEETKGGQEEEWGYQMSKPPPQCFTSSFKSPHPNDSTTLQNSTSLAGQQVFKEKILWEIFHLQLLMRRKPAICLKSHSGKLRF